MKDSSRDRPRSHMPPLELQRAVKIAVRRLQKIHPPVCHDHHEWLCDCEQEAWLAVLKAAPRYRCPDPPPSNPEAHYVLWLAGKALKRLRRYWRQEARYYGQVVPMVQENEAGEEEELEFADEGSLVPFEEVEERLLAEQVLERLSPYLDATDWAILQGLLEGKAQLEVARGLGLSQQAVSKRLRAIRRLAREILQESG